jgi:hypothetical protein
MRDKKTDEAIKAVADMIRERGLEGARKLAGVLTELFKKASKKQQEEIFDMLYTEVPKDIQNDTYDYFVTREAGF